MNKKIEKEYLKDESSYAGTADEIIFIRDASEIKKYIEGFNNITLQGSRTGISASCVPTGGCIVNMSAFNNDVFFEKDEKNYYIDCPCGITIEEVEKMIRKKETSGYYLPVEPTEKSSTIGGIISSNAQGPSPLSRYKVSDFIKEAEVFFPSIGMVKIEKGQYIFDDNGELEIAGNKIETQYLNNNDKKIVDMLTPYCGMDLLELLCGSEGMLGIIIRVKFLLMPAKKNRWKILCFAKDEVALKVASNILVSLPAENNIELLALDMIDNNSVSLVKDRLDHHTKYEKIPKLPEDECGALLIDLAADSEDDAENVLEEILNLFDQAGISDDRVWAADSFDEQEIIEIFRHAVPESVNAKIEDAKRDNDDIRKFAIDVCAPDVDINEVRKKVYDQKVPCAMTVHMGRGVFHIDFFAETAEKIDDVKKAKNEMILYFLDKNAIFAAENGYGKGKYEGLEKYISERQKKIIENIKESFDPELKLNRGNLWL